MSAQVLDGMTSCKCLAMFVCLSYCPIFIGLSSLITYISLGIHFLVSDYGITTSCPESYLWEYVLVSIIFSPLFYLHHYLKIYSNVKRKIRFKILIFSVLAIFCVLICGGFGLYDHSFSCENDDTDLYKFGISSFIFDIIFMIYGFFNYLHYLLPPEDTSQDLKEENLGVFIQPRLQKETEV